MPPDSSSGAKRRRSTARRLRAEGSIEITTNGDLTVVDLIDRFATRMSDPQTVMVAEQPVREAIKRLFAANGGGRWRKTSDETTEEKREKGLRTEPMRASDALYESLTNPHARGGFLKLTRRGERTTTLRIGSTLPQGRFQRQFGRDASLLDDQCRLEVTEAILRRVFS